MLPLARRLGPLVLVLLTGCQVAAPTSPAGGARQSGASQPGSGKTITLAALNSVKGFSPWLVGTTGGGARSLTEIHTNGLVTRDARGNLAPQLAAKMPSFDDGSIVVLPDGRMQTTWKLRPNAKWHDGAAFTAEPAGAAPGIIEW